MNSKEQRIIFLKKQSGFSLMGITQGEFVIDGMDVAVDKGGGKISSMVLKDGMIYVRKCDKDGKPHRDFGTISMPGGTHKRLVADGIAFPANLAKAILFHDQEVTDAAPAPAKAEELPPAKPAQQSQGQQQGQNRR